jgi:hypothetical protein
VTEDLECAVTEDLECAVTEDLECAVTEDLECATTEDLECVATKDLAQHFSRKDKARVSPRYNPMSKKWGTKRVIAGAA